MAVRPLPDAASARERTPRVLGGRSILHQRLRWGACLLSFLLLAGCLSEAPAASPAPPTILVTGPPIERAPQSPQEAPGGMRAIHAETNGSVTGSVERVDVRFTGFENTVRLVWRATGVEVWMRAPEACVIATDQGVSNRGSAFVFLTQEDPRAALDFSGGCAGSATLHLARWTGGGPSRDAAPFEEPI